MSRVLLVEDSVDCQILVSRALQGLVDLQVAGSIADAQRLLSTNQYELLLLDVGLEDGSGFGLCSNLRSGEPAARRARVIFLTANRDIQEKLVGFSVGADDYITKPFEPLELKARVMAHLRAHAESKEAAETIQIGNLTLNMGTYSAEILSESGLARPDLTPTEFKLLHALAKNEGRVLSRDQLLDFLNDHGQDVLDRTVDVHISKLRKKLETCTHSIEAVYGIGYRWIRIKAH